MKKWAQSVLCHCGPILITGAHQMIDRLRKLDFVDLFLWLIRFAIIAVVLTGTIKSIIDSPYSSRNWLDFLIFGIAQGSMYALIAIGYTLVYGVLRMINFAHGEVFRAGILTLTVLVAIPMSNSGYLVEHPAISITVLALVSIAVSIAIALLTERIAYKPL